MYSIRLHWKRTPAGRPVYRAMPRSSPQNLAGFAPLRADPGRGEKMEVRKMESMNETFRHYPRFLPLVHIHGAFFVDERLGEFRRADNIHRRVPFGSRRGRSMLSKFYVDTCGTCGQEVAIPRRRLTSTVRCRVCGAVVRTGDS